jgi:hypothetical protein
MTDVRVQEDNASFSADTGIRRSFVEGQYEHLWQGVSDKLDRVLAQGETDLSRVHLFMRRNFGPDFEDEMLREKYAQHERKMVETGYLLDRQLIRVSELDPRVVTLLTDSVKMRELISIFGAGSRRIIELGSGWGKNLFNLYKFGAPLAAEYWGFELTRTGRELMERVGATCAPEMTIRSSPFDYYEADFSGLEGDAETCVFTHHSIEQIPVLPDTLIDRILAIPGFRVCVHMEPVGFQFASDKWLDEPAGKDLMDRVDAENRRFAEKRNQNSNLYGLLRRYESEGRIRIFSVKKYFTSHLLSNATTVIAWTAADGISREHFRRDDL